jgi:hypothetical protein
MSVMLACTTVWTSSVSALTITEIISSWGDGAGNTLGGPMGIAADEDGNVYVAGYYSDNAFEITPFGAITEIIDSTGDGAGCLLQWPPGIAVSRDGNVYVTGAGASDNAFEITPAGVITEIINSTGDGAGNILSMPWGIAVDAAGNVYVAGGASDNAFEITPAGGITEIIDSTGDGAGNSLAEPRGVAVDASGNVYVTGAQSDNAFEITPAGVITEIIDSTGDGAGNALDNPWGIAADGAGNVYVAGADSNNAFKITSGGAITEIIDSTGDGAGSGLVQPFAIAVDEAGNVYVSGRTSDNAFKITSGGTITEIIDSTGDGAGNTLDSPYGGIVVDCLGRVYVTGLDSENAFKIEDEALSEQAELLASDGAGGDWFGYAVDIYEDVAVIGARSDANTNGDSAGAAYVFRFDGVDWVEQAKLMASDGFDYEEFGASVAINIDTIVVGAPQHMLGQGAAYVFVEPPGGWDSVPPPIFEDAKLTASDGVSGDALGHSVAVANDTVMAGAPWDTNPNGNGAGAVYYFDEPLTGWANVTETGKLLATDADGLYASDCFGYSVAMHGTTTTVVGAPHDDATTNNAGAVYDFEYQPLAGGWSQWQKLLASDGQKGDNFGHSVDTVTGAVAVGAPYDDDNGTNSGSAYLFGWYLSGFTERDKLLACAGAPFDYFGWSVAIGHSLEPPYGADRILVGVPMDDDYGDSSGSAYLFQWHDNDTPGDGLDDFWFHRGKLRALDAQPGDDFGAAVAMSGQTAMVGAPDHDFGVGPGSGAAYVFAPGLEQHECVATDVRSYRAHTGVGQLYIDMGTSDGIEPRQGGIQTLEIDLDDAAGANQVVAVNCWPTGWAGSVPFAVSGLVGNTVTVDFSPALPDQSYCELELDCGGLVCVRSCEGDLNLSGGTTVSDNLQCKIRFGQTATNANCQWDFNLSGSIGTADALQIKVRFGYAAPQCP